MLGSGDECWNEVLLMKFKTCPFCKSMPFMRAWTTGEGDDELARYQLECAGCGIRTPQRIVGIGFLPKEVAEIECEHARQTLVEQWNRREGENIDPEIVGSMVLTHEMVRAALHSFNPNVAGWFEMHKALMAAIKVARESKK